MVLRDADPRHWSGERDRSGVARVPEGMWSRRNDQHDDAEREYRQSHEFKYQRVKHGKSPNKSIDLQGSD
jgi:hypothetical protein